MKLRIRFPPGRPASRIRLMGSSRIFQKPPKQAKVNWDERITIPSANATRTACRGHWSPRFAGDLSRTAITSRFSETERSVRVIPTDGRRHRKNYRAWAGRFTRAREGETLVVDVTGLRAKTWPDQGGNFGDENELVVERFTMTEPNTMGFEAKVTDPVLHAMDHAGSP